jgi:hypothetical protein
MKSRKRGRNTLAAEVTNVASHGFWLLIDKRERFVSFKDFPWFRNATLAELTNVEMPSSQHLYWPELEVDLAVESLDHPERHPLVSKALPHRQEKARAVTVGEPRAVYNVQRRRRRGLAAGRQ